MEGLLENVRQLSRELHLQMMIIDNFIPPEYQVSLQCQPVENLNESCHVKMGNKISVVVIPKDSKAWLKIFRRVEQ